MRFVQFQLLSLSNIIIIDLKNNISNSFVTAPTYVLYYIIKIKSSTLLPSERHIRGRNSRSSHMRRIRLDWLGGKIV